jgi:hypothetical protein
LASTSRELSSDAVHLKTDLPHGGGIEDVSAVEDKGRL